ncbi:hypothetical protein LOTGIDRAFT_230067 [Lottia gigantea]|uniref:Uncharacterized protein n=1 Tax=Lottia gigantea TaxID=225164 RepID=V4BBQ8_LOTGI|nr:hypothetical protein LOTGIDRAFT_230067 [Lottia gigantea]ESP05031.1 hypothetical protein LOTGIDRAFT_230067 [Lottia gigantea]
MPAAIPPTTAAPVKLADIELPEDIKTIFDKYATNSTVNYEAFLNDLKGATSYNYLIDTLKIEKGEFTKDKLESLYKEYLEPENSSSRNGVTIVTVVMVSVVSMLVPYLK